MTVNKSNSVVLIGMPGAGKSTVGILLAKELGLGFIDTDESVPAKEAKAGEVHANNKEGVKKKKCKGATKDAGGALDLNVFCRWMIFLNWAAPSDFNSTFDPDEIKKDYPSAQGHFTKKSSFGNAEMPAYEPCKTWL